MNAPMEWPAVQTSRDGGKNYHKCIFIHLTDRDSVEKGVSGVDRSGVRWAEMSGNGYRDIDGLYTLIKTESEPSQLYTMFHFNLEGEHDG
tara:strand:- start:122 stop:391 length:270 start_codon:yes stop_codon:yes gene_type:complete